MSGVRRFAHRIFDFYWGQGIADDVPALTYYLVLSLAPFALGVAALEALLLNDILSAYEVAGQLNRFLPEDVHGDIRGLVVGARDNSPELLTIAVAAMLWTTSGAIGVIERCESRMLDSERHGIVLGRIRNVGLGALVGVAFLCATSGAPVLGDLVRRLDVSGILPGGVFRAGNAMGAIVVFAIIFRYAPRSRLRWRAAFLGAIPAGIALQVVPVIVGLYFDAAAGFQAERIFLLLAVLLFGLYAMALALLVGAGVAVKSEVRARDRAARLAESERPAPLAPAPAPQAAGSRAAT